MFVIHGIIIISVFNLIILGFGFCINVILLVLDICRYIDSSHTEIVRIGSMDVNKGYVVVYTLHTPFTDTGVDYCIPSL